MQLHCATDIQFFLSQNNMDKNFLCYVYSIFNILLIQPINSTANALYRSYDTIAISIYVLLKYLLLRLRTIYHIPILGPEV
jgi:hypothetical protein